MDKCPSPAEDANIHARALHEACLRLGGEHKLAEYLGVGEWLISRWLKGDGKPPDSLFLRCVDLIDSTDQSPP